MSTVLDMANTTQATTKAGLAAGTTTTFTTANTTQYSINGIAYSKAGVTNSATPTTDAGTGNAYTGITALKSTLFVFCWDSAGAVKVYQGTVVNLDAAGNFVTAPEYPPIINDHCPFGLLVVSAGSTLSGTWTFGSSNLSSVTGMTYVFKDIQTLPAQVPLS